MKTNFRYNRNSTFTRRRISYKNESTSKNIKIESLSLKGKAKKIFYNSIDFMTKSEGVIAFFIILINVPIISTLKKILKFILFSIN